MVSGRVSVKSITQGLGSNSSSKLRFEAFVLGIYREIGCSMNMLGGLSFIVSIVSIPTDFLMNWG